MTGNKKPRAFDIKQREAKGKRLDVSRGEKLLHVRVLLHHGDVVVMEGSQFQEQLLHGVPKYNLSCGQETGTSRINVTWRAFLPPGERPNTSKKRAADKEGEKPLKK